MNLASINQSDIAIERVIESVEPGKNGCRIWIDMFLNKTSCEPQNLLLLHRGSLRAANVTSESWLHTDDSSNGKAFSLTKRITQLHQKLEPLCVFPSACVMVGDRGYRVSNASLRLQTIVGEEHGQDIPFSLWEIGEFTSSGRQVVRVCLSMSREAFEKELGTDQTFYTYGGGMLLDKIEHEDFISYRGANAEVFRRAFLIFKSALNVIPDVFEYLLVSLESAELQWEALPLSHFLSPQIVFPEELQSNTQWFVAGTAERPRDSELDPRYDGFVVKLKHSEVWNKQWAHAATA